MDDQLQLHSVTYISESFIKPELRLNQTHCHLTPWDLAMLSVHHIQKGLLYKKPPQFYIQPFLAELKDSLATVLAHFYPLAGRLETRKEDNPHCYLVYIDCEKGPGAKFIHARADLSTADVMDVNDVSSPVVHMFVDHDQCVNHDGHERALVSIQVTELLDGIFIGCSMNHCVADGTSYWHFFNMWSEIFQAKRNRLESASISTPPVLERWFPDGCGPIISLPYKHPHEFVTRYNAPELKERFFHFSIQSVAKLKAKANADANTTKISSFQSLCALLWRVITRARSLRSDQTTRCMLSANVRPRLNPPLPQNYFGNYMDTVQGVSSVVELLEHNLGWAALVLHNGVVNYTDENARKFLKEWLQAPKVYQLGQYFDPCCVMMGSSPRFNMYGNEFGLGKALGIRSGSANEFDGKVSSYPGYEGGGSVDVEVCLTPRNMKAFECDEELLDALS
ncbi:unnamed protein product [Rhodiola kirilowii]